MAHGLHLKQTNSVQMEHPLRKSLYFFGLLSALRPNAKSLITVTIFMNLTGFIGMASCHMEGTSPSVVGTAF